VLWRFFMIGIIASELSPHLKRGALPLFVLGALLLALDFLGPRADWIAKLGIGLAHEDHSTLGLGLSCGLLLASLPHLPRVGAAMNVLPLRLIGVISYSVYITHFFYIQANAPIIERFTTAGSQALYEQFKTWPAMPGWYLPVVFFPGILAWGAVSFLLVERPGMRLGQWLLRRQKRGAIRHHEAGLVAAE
jgi:peptidoglycan/LPS O-acetylase OafA/YrhL